MDGTMAMRTGQRRGEGKEKEDVASLGVMGALEP